MKTNKLLKISIALIGLSLAANAERTEQFTWGATGKFGFLGGTNKDGSQVTTFKNDFKLGRSWGMALKAVRNSTNKASGWRAVTPKDYNGGFMSVLTNTTGFDNARAWSAFWHWNGNHDWSNEMDLVELTPSSCQWNSYYNRQTGPKVNNPFWWRNQTAVHSLRWYPKNVGGTFTSPWKSQWVAHDKARWNAKTNIRISQRPWAFGGNANGGWKRFGNMNIDWAKIPF